MSRSYHVTKKQLVKERIENAIVDPNDPSSQMTELEVADIRKGISKINDGWKKQASRDRLRPGLRMKLTDKGVKVE